MYFCAISGEPPQEPVISPKSGQLYERRLILKYIAENGTDPTTGDKLDESDLVTLKAHPKASAPRPPSATSIPALLHTLQNEYDALMLEFHARNQQHQATRQELSNALYHQDAATRVIARLIRERDAAREALASVQATTGLTSTAPEVEMGEPAGVLPKEVMDVINETEAGLSSTRKKRKAHADHAKPDDLKAYTRTHTIPSLHASNPSGITALTLSSTNHHHFVTGGNDKHVQLYDRNTAKVLATLKGHTKRINSVRMREKTGEHTMIISGSADKTVRVWTHDEPSGHYAPSTTFKNHKGEITGIDVHPSGSYLAVGSADSSWSLQDLSTLSTLYQSPTADEAYTSLSLHPDGFLLGLGTHGGKIQIYDIRSQDLVASLTPSSDTFIVNTLSFSENGYHLAAPASTTSVAIWDLRKQLSVATIPLPNSDGPKFRLHKVKYDHSANWFGAATTNGIGLWAYKTWEEIVHYNDAGECVDLAFGPLGKEVWGVGHREVRVWGKEVEA